MLPLQIHLTLPPWIDEVADIGRRYASDDDRVGLAIELSRQNVERGGGGPFGAAVFDAVSGRLVAVGVNRVVSQNCSVAHAEMMAIMIAQQRLSRSRMNEDDGHYVLATTCALDILPRQFDRQANPIVVAGIASADVGDLIDPWRQGEMNLQWQHALAPSIGQPVSPTYRARSRCD